MPPRPQALPRLLRDDALAHLKREYKGTVTLQSDHPLKGSSLGGSYRLHLPGAAQLAIQIDARSELSGTARLRFCADEAGLHEVARFDGIALGRWQNVTAAGDTLWVHAAGETARHGTRGGPALRPARAPPCNRIRPTSPRISRCAPPCDPPRPTHATRGARTRCACARFRRDRAAAKLWGFRVRMTAEAWMPPELEAQTLDTPLPIGWQLLELL